jgi:DNA-directed RNA polymerase subunit beta'
MLGLSVSDLEKVIYFAGYIVTSVKVEEKTNILKELDIEFKSKMKSAKDETEKDKIRDSLSEVKKEIDSLYPGKVLDEAVYHKYSLKYGTLFEAGIGAEAIYKMFQSVDLSALSKELEHSYDKVSTIEREKVQKRINLVKTLRRSGVRPEWMFLTVLPVTPPALRPMVALDGGRHATSDVNDLYRRVINRNNRLKKLIEISAPEVIQRNEKRILQEAVDALIDNSIRHAAGGGGAVSQAQRRPLKSLADMLKGKHGRFRQNLLGKRVDYSGRSVIVVGPDLKLGQCGLPKKMALELFRPFVIAKILEKELAFNIRGAGRLMEEGVPEVWAILEDVIKDKRVLLNRAPTLHRLGIQALQPVLIEGNAIQLHPLVCTAFNADFDGDQMAVHVPLSVEAQKEAKELMAANKNLLGPGNGDPIVIPKKLDIILGCYWMTRIIEGEKGEGKIFTNPNRAIAAYDFGFLGLRAKIKVLPNESVKYAAFEGKVFDTTVGRLLFNSVLPTDYPFINGEVTGKEMTALGEDLIIKYGADAVPEVLDKLKSFGYRYATRSGITWGMDDLRIPTEKKEIVKTARDEAANVEQNYQDGFLSDDERYRMLIEIWSGVHDRIGKLIPKTLDPRGSVYDMVISKARGSLLQITQMAGMKGLIVNTTGEVIELPIIPSYKEGLSPLEYFITTHGARKGLTDTALNTAKAGYLTRKLVDVSQDTIITTIDCGDKKGRMIRRNDATFFDSGIVHNVRGRVLAQDLKNNDGEIVYKKGSVIYKKDAYKIDELGVPEVWVRSPLTCLLPRGVCAHCYGLDLGKNAIVKVGEAVGIIAAQAIGEPGTQLTMRTFHVGGVAEAGGDITMGLPRVEEIFEKRAPKSAAVLSEVDGTVMDIKDDKKGKIITILGEKSIDHLAPPRRGILVKKGQLVKKGDFLSEGAANLNDILRLLGRNKAEQYILHEIDRVYSLQGVTIARKHIEIVVRQMFSRSKIKKVGDTLFLAGEVVDNDYLAEENNRMKEEGGELAIGDNLILGISEVALTTSSWLSAASFQNTSRVLIDTALKGGVDKLRGLKENVIVGRLIPAGSGTRPVFESVHGVVSEEE